MTTTLSKLARAGVVVGVVGAGAVPMQAFLAASPASASTTVGSIGPGASGPGTKCVQRGLNLLGIQVTADGLYGSQTQQGVLLFQKKFGFSRRDGVVMREEGTYLAATLGSNGLPNCYSVIPTVF